MTGLGQLLQDQQKEKRHGNLKQIRMEKLQVLVDEGILDCKPLRTEENKWYIRFQAVLNYVIDHGNVNMPANEDFLLEDGTNQLIREH